jgi:hypothetical protein
MHAPQHISMLLKSSQASTNCWVPMRVLYQQAKSATPALTAPITLPPSIGGESPSGIGTAPPPVDFADDGGGGGGHHDEYGPFRYRIVLAMHSLDRADECAGAAPPRSSTARAG